MFTVQLRDGAAAAPGLSGRLTHAATGEASHFDSADELVALLVAGSERLRAESTRLRRSDPHVTSPT